MVNGFYIKGKTTAYNIGGTDSRLDLMDYYVVVKDATDTIIGCTANKLT